MLDRIQKVFIEVSGRPNLVITEETKLDNNLGFNSLGFIQLICALEDEFDVDVPNTEIKKIKTVGDIIEFLEDNM